MIKIAIPFCVGLLALGACSEKPTTHHKVERIYHTSDNRYFYQDDGVTWWLYMSMTQNGSSTQVPYSGSVALTSGSGLPSGVVWGQGTQPTAEELTGATEADVELEFMADGEPAVEGTIGTAEAVEPAGTVESPTSETGAASAPSDSSSSSSSDSGSSGGGGDSGGGGSD
jgi:hypothetical protein